MDSLVSMIMKAALRYISRCVGYACVLYVAMLAVDAMGSVGAVGRYMLRDIVVTLAIGVCFGLFSTVWVCDALPSVVKLAVQWGGGLVCALLISWFADPSMLNRGVLAVLDKALFVVAAAVAIGIVSSVLAKNDARLINEQLAHRQARR